MVYLTVLMLGISSAEALAETKATNKSSTEILFERYRHFGENTSTILSYNDRHSIADVFNDTEAVPNLNYATFQEDGTINLTKVQGYGVNHGESFNWTDPGHGKESLVDNEPETILPTNNTTSNQPTPCYNCRLKRLIFGKDNRIKLKTSTSAQKFPFSTGVKISTGCSGSLISPYHVLTAAHCIHNGKRLLKDIAGLRVGFLRRNGKLRWMRVKHVRLPQNWRHQTNSAYDYAVIRLRRAHQRPFFKLGVILRSHRNFKLHFVSFPGDKSVASMWYTHCFARALPSLLIARCDAASGSSGAGVYVRTASRRLAKRRRVIVGTVSGYGRVRLPDGRIKRFNFVTRFTLAKAQQICQWIGAGSKCISWTSRSLSARGQL